jgi:hypothetical protein
MITFARAAISRIAVYISSARDQMMVQPVPPPGGSNRDGVNLRLLWPQWQGAGTSSVRELASEFPFDVARRGYAVGSAVLEAVLPPHDGPTVTVPVAVSDDGLAERDGVEAKAVILGQLARALAAIGLRLSRTAARELPRGSCSNGTRSVTPAPPGPQSTWSCIDRPCARDRPLASPSVMPRPSARVATGAT